jgi:signal transduction histidine kinase
LRRITQIQEQERLRLARELHDEMGQQLTVLLLGLKRLEEASHGRAATLQLVHEVRQVADTLGQQVHHLATELRPIALTDVGLVPALESYVEEWSARTGIAAEMACVGLDRERRLAPEVETTIYRVVQEAFTNVARHAAATATRVSLVLRRDDTHLVTIVEDDGPASTSTKPLTGAGWGWWACGSGQPW